MKTDDISSLVDDLLSMPKAQIVIQLPNGQRIATNDYHHDINGAGQTVIVIQAGRKLDKSH